jgi:hypothetical protein
MYCEITYGENIYGVEYFGTLQTLVDSYFQPMRNASQISQERDGNDK